MQSHLYLIQGPCWHSLEGWWPKLGLDPSSTGGLTAFLDSPCLSEELHMFKKQLPPYVRRGISCDLL